MTYKLFVLVFVGLAAASAIADSQEGHQHAAFTAVSNDNANYNAGDTVVFNSVLTNDDGGYDKTTGVFTAPEQGTYAFSVSLKVPQGAGGPRKIELVFQGNVVATAASSMSSSDFVILSLGLGEQVSVRNAVDNTQFAEGTSFSGFCLRN